MSVESRIIPVKKFNSVPEDWECAICLEDSNSEVTFGHICDRSQEGVRHQYHEECLENWLETNSSCPECREPLAKRNVKVKNAEQALIQLELNFPGIVDAPRNYLSDALSTLKISLPISFGLVALDGIRLGSNPFPIGPTFSGAFLSFIISKIARAAFRERSPVYDTENDVERFRQMFKSKSFSLALAGTAAIMLSTSPSYLLTTLPLEILGFGVYYGIERLHAYEFISEEAKRGSQIITSIATTALSLMAPIATITSGMFGAVLGATVETYYAPNEIESEA